MIVHQNELAGALRKGPRGNEGSLAFVGTSARGDGWFGQVDASFL
jgi:hypothetical protein